MARKAKRAARRGRTLGRTAGAVSLLGVSSTLVAQTTADATFGTGGAEPSPISHDEAAGTLDINAPGAGSTNRLNVDVTGLYPGASLYHGVALTTAGTLDFSSLNVSASAVGGGGLIFSDTTNGATLAIDLCIENDFTTQKAYTETSTSPYTYTCPGGNFINVLPAAAIGSLNSTPYLSQPSKLLTGSTHYLRLKFSIPNASLNTAGIQGTTATVTLTFNGAQRAALYR